MRDWDCGMRCAACPMHYNQGIVSLSAACKQQARVRTLNGKMWSSRCAAAFSTPCSIELLFAPCSVGVCKVGRVHEP